MSLSTILQVTKLQSVLAAVETYTVSEPSAPPRSAGLRFASGHSYGASRGYRSLSTGDGSSLSSGLAALTQPFKLRLARAEHEKQLKDYATNVVLIEPLASMTAVEDFLWSKVYRSSASPPPSAAPAADMVSMDAATGSDSKTCFCMLWFTMLWVIGGEACPSTLQHPLASVCLQILSGTTVLCVSCCK